MFGVFVLDPTLSFRPHCKVEELQKAVSRIVGKKEQQQQQQQEEDKDEDEDDEEEDAPIDTLLSRLNLAQYAAAFQGAGIDLVSDLREADEQDLKELGVKKFHLKRLLKAASTPNPTTPPHPTQP